MSYSIYVFLMLIFFILAPFYLLLRIVDYTGYVFIGAIRKGKKEWNWFPEMNWKLYSLLFSAAIISMFIGAIPIKYVNWDSLPGYSAYPLFYILIALILLLVYLFEISSPYSVADSIRAKLDHKNLLKVEKNNSLALMENEKDQPTIVFENFTIKNNNLNYNPSYKNCFQNITKEGDTFNQTTTNAYYDKKPRIKRLPFEKQKDLSRSFEKLFEKAKKWD